MVFSACTIGTLFLVYCLLTDDCVGVVGCACYCVLLYLLVMLLLAC